MKADFAEALDKGMTVRQREILGMMDHCFCLGTLGLMDKGQSFRALQELAAYMRRGLDMVEPDAEAIANKVAVPYRVKIDGVDIHSGMGGITSFCGWGGTREEAAKNYLLTCADQISTNIGLWQRVRKSDHGLLRQGMGFCVDCSETDRFDFVTQTGKPLEPFAVAATVLQNPLRPLPQLKLKPSP